MGSKLNLQKLSLLGGSSQLVSALRIPKDSNGMVWTYIAGVFLGPQNSHEFEVFSDS